MRSKREKSLVMHMRKIAVVICEGETEESYIHLLRQWYKSPIKIVPHIEGSRITPSLVEKRVREVKISLNDDVRVFLMYDMDVPAINEKIQKCKATPLLSNPCFELWLLLHAKEQNASISTERTIKELEKSMPLWECYSKSSFTKTQKQYLKKQVKIAVGRAKKLKDFQNPSTGVYKLVRLLEGSVPLQKK